MVEFRKNASRDTLYDLAVKNGVAVAENADRDAIIKALTAHNMQEAAGRHDLTGQLLHSLGEDVELTGLDEKMVSLSPDADIHFCTLME